jgi:prepilin-type N-terminal cleavage/methylation domain-containing protein
VGKEEAMKIRKNLERGFTLIELTAAVTALALSLLAALHVVR